MFPITVELFGRFVNQLDPNHLWNKNKIRKNGDNFVIMHRKMFFWGQFWKCVASQLAQMADRICIISHLCQITVIIKILFEIANSRVFKYYTIAWIWRGNLFEFWRFVWFMALHILRNTNSTQCFKYKLSNLGKSFWLYRFGTLY